MNKSKLIEYAKEYREARRWKDEIAFYVKENHVEDHADHVLKPILMLPAQDRPTKIEEMVNVCKLTIGHNYWMFIGNHILGSKNLTNAYVYIYATGAAEMDSPQELIKLIIDSVSDSFIDKEECNTFRRAIKGNLYNTKLRMMYKQPEIEKHVKACYDMVNDLIKSEQPSW